MIRTLLPWSMIAVWGVTSLAIYLLAVGFGGAWLLRPPPANAPFFFQIEWYVIATILAASLIFAALRLVTKFFQKAFRAPNQ